MKINGFVLHTASLLAFASLLAVAPSGYYSSAEGLTGTQLKSALHGIIRTTNSKLTYSQVWTALEILDKDPANSNNIICIYSNRSIPRSAKDGSGSASVEWNREHSWPKSYGFSVESWPGYTDLHHMYASYDSYNSARGNEWFDVTPTGTTYPVTGTNENNISDSDSWQAWSKVRGNLARSMFYMAVRYEGGSSTEPNLELTNDVSKLVVQNGGTAYMGKLDTLLAWHAEDPVDAAEIARNDLVYYGLTNGSTTLRQGNRNPFVDRPEWVNAIWGGTSTPVTVPSLVSGQTVSGTVAGTAWLNYKITATAGQQMVVSMTGSGDADLYIRLGSQPTTSSYDQRPYVNGSVESATINPTVSGTYYISIRGSAATSSVSLTATLSTPSSGGGTPVADEALASGVARSGTIASNVWKYYYIDVPANSSLLTVAMTGTGDADLYVRGGSKPTSSTFDQRPYLDGTNETATVSSPAGTRYWIGVNGYATSSSYSIKATVTATSAPATGTLQLVRVLPNPVGTDTYAEAVELRNTSSVSVNVAEWKVVDSQNTTWTTFTGTLAAGQSKIFYNPGTGMVLSNSGDSVSLKTPQGATVRTISWTATTEGTWLY